MLLVIAHRSDAAAQALVTRWAAVDAARLTADDLSRPGWRYRLGTVAHWRAVLAGHSVATSEISGVLTRLPAIAEQELRGIAPEERSYVAAEMTAFLRAWLSALPCPVLNRPSPTCLGGPGWRPERWTLAAASLGLPTTAVRRRAVPPVSGRLAADEGSPASGPPDPPSVPVTVVGERCLGTVDEALAEQAQLLARAAGADLLVVRFSGAEAGSRFVGADLWPDISDPAVADAVLDHFSARSHPLSGVRVTG
jgi:hypothetical protein